MRRKGDDAFSAPGVMNPLRYFFGYSIQQEKDWPMSTGKFVRLGWTCCASGCLVAAAAAGFRGTVLRGPPPPTLQPGRTRPRSWDTPRA